MGNRMTKSSGAAALATAIAVALLGACSSETPEGLLQSAKAYIAKMNTEPGSHSFCKIRVGSSSQQHRFM